LKRVAYRKPNPNLEIFERFFGPEPNPNKLENEENKGIKEPQKISKIEEILETKPIKKRKTTSLTESISS